MLERENNIRGVWGVAWDAGKRAEAVLGIYKGEPWQNRGRGTYAKGRGARGLATKAAKKPITITVELGGERGGRSG